jgi:hypothetical protein
MLQHGLGGLRASATQHVIELVDAHGVRALVALERHATPILGSPVDGVHFASILAARFALRDRHHIPVTLVREKEGAISNRFLEGSLTNSRS